MMSQNVLSFMSVILIQNFITEYEGEKFKLWKGCVIITLIFRKFRMTSL
jgi:hypothetical protein